MTEWRTIDFRPITQPGWRAVFLTGDFEPGEELTWIEDLAGWLIEEHPDTGARRAVAAVVDDADGEIYAASAPGQLFRVLTPNEEPPDNNSARRETERRLMASINAPETHP